MQYNFVWLSMASFNSLEMYSFLNWKEKKTQSTTCDIPFTTNIHQNGNKRDKQKHFIYNKCNGTFSIRLEISIPACIFPFNTSIKQYIHNMQLLRENFVANDKRERYCFENPVNNLKYSSVESDWKIVDEHFFFSYYVEIKVLKDCHFTKCNWHFSNSLLIGNYSTNEVFPANSNTTALWMQQSN